MQDIRTAVTREEDAVTTHKSDTHACPYCELVFRYHEEVKDHILHDHPDHGDVVATVEMHELPHD